MNCDRLQRDLYLLSWSELPPKRERAVRAHLSDCPDCESVYRRILDEEERLRAAFAAPEPPSSLWSALRVEMESAPVRDYRPLRRFRSWALGLAVTGAALAGIALYHAVPDSPPILSPPSAQVEAPAVAADFTEQHLLHGWRDPLADPVALGLRVRRSNGDALRKARS